MLAAINFIFLQHDIDGPQRKHDLLPYSNWRYFNRKFGKDSNNTGKYFRWEESEIIKKSLSSANNHYKLYVENHQRLCQHNEIVSTK